MKMCMDVEAAEIVTALHDLRQAAREVLSGAEGAEDRLREALAGSDAAMEATEQWWSLVPPPGSGA